MRPVAFSSSVVADTLGRLRVASMPQLVDALGGPSERTVFRKLNELDTLSSYSHRGRYYTLRASARFDRHGLWAQGAIRFSVRGTLRATAAALTEAAPRGWRLRELDELLGVHSRATLRGLVQASELACVQVEGRPLYCSADPDRQRRQVASRSTPGLPLPLPPPPLPPGRQARAEAATQRFAGLLDERQRRLFAGLASVLCGHGGDKRAAAWLGLHPKTVAKGRRELTGGPLPPGRVRRPGGGRKPLAKESPL